MLREQRGASPRLKQKGLHLAAAAVAEQASADDQERGDATKRERRIDDEAADGVAHVAAQQTVLATRTGEVASRVSITSRSVLQSGRRLMAKSGRPFWKPAVIKRRSKKSVGRDAFPDMSQLGSTPVAQRA